MGRPDQGGPKDLTMLDLGQAEKRSGLKPTKKKAIKATMFTCYVNNNKEID